jgi:hypothetical protein
MEPRLCVAVPVISEQQQGLIEEHFLGLERTDAMPVVLTAVTVIPVEGERLGQFDHPCICPQYTRSHLSP